MKISGVAIGQWNDNCRKVEGKRRTTYKILRAIVMGKVSHYYTSGDYIVRYFDMNILVSKTGEVLVVWRDKTRPPHTVHEDIKSKYDAETTFTENSKKAFLKHIIAQNRYQNEKLATV